MWNNIISDDFDKAEEFRDQIASVYENDDSNECKTSRKGSSEYESDGMKTEYESDRKSEGQWAEVSEINETNDIGEKGEGRLQPVNNLRHWRRNLANR